VPAAAETLAPGQQPDGFQQIGLALAVGPAQHRQVGVGVQHGVGQVAVVGQFQMGKPHQEPSATCTARPSSSTTSPARHFLPRIVHTSPLTVTAPAWISSLASPPVSHTPANLSRASSLMNSVRSEEHTSELQSRFALVCRLLLEIR